MAYKVTAVWTEQPPGYSHPHIEKLKLSDGTIETRARVIRYIRELQRGGLVLN